MFDGSIGTGVRPGLRVWLLHLGEPVPLDRETRPYRYGQLAEELARRGHSVVRWAPRFDHFTGRLRPAAAGLHVASSAGYQVCLLDGGEYSGRVGLQRMVFHWRCAFDFVRRARRMPLPDVVVCSTPVPELAATAAAAMGRKGVPVVVDVRDLWPDALLRHLEGTRALLRAPLRGWWTGCNRFALGRAVALTGVSEAYLEWGLKHAGRSRRPVDGAFFIGAPRAAHSRAVGNPSAPPGLVFFGSLSRHFDFDQLVAAARTFRKVDFHVCGMGPAEGGLRRAAEELKNLRIWGWRTPEELGALSAQAIIGLAPYAADAAMTSTNKVAEYLSFGLPILGSLGGEAMDRVLAAGAGWRYDPTVPGALAAELGQILGEPDALARAGASARALFEEEFEGGRIAARFADLVERIARRED